MDSTGSRASRESGEGLSSEDDGDCDVFLSDSDSDRALCPAAPAGLPLRGRPASGVPSPAPQAFIPHPMSASHLKKPLENIYFASAPARPCPPPPPGGASRGGAWKLSLDGGHHLGQYPERFRSRGSLKRRREWDASEQQGTVWSEKAPCAKTKGDLLFAQKCKELQAFIRPLTILLDGLKTGRYNKGLTSFQQSVAMDRIQRIVGVLQKPGMGERYLGTLLQVEMMLKVWFPHVTTATPGAEGSGPTGSECNTRKHIRTGSSETSSSWESLSPSSFRRPSFSDGAPQESADRTPPSRSWEERSELRGGSWERVAWRDGPLEHPPTLRCLALVMQDGSDLSSSTTTTTTAHPEAVWPVQGAWASIVKSSACQRHPGRSSSAPPCIPAARSSTTSWPLVLSCGSVVLLDLPVDYGRQSQK
ncbi:circadian associated repressor of transcription a [Rhincodon typus]|uniref:circadian associated repressor of transcription a n=1 Tax=Rhincodon typus TaxID=259920 RepID=UPI00203069DB|nr:circadian associated repressor of transcription a [Rhincodon typus]XP_048476346.1 circadian associated repressor of transcription a [Rhincodon typus]